MGNTELLIFLLVFAAILGAYGLGMSERLPRPRGSLQPTGAIHPAEVLLEYRNATGIKTRQKIKVIDYMHRHGGRSCLLAICNNDAAPRTFRIDRIISVATLDDEVIDTKRFPTETLGVPV